VIDLTTDFGHRVEKRLWDEWIIWLTTSGSDLTPQPRPVWFYWNGLDFLIFSRPDTHKLRHISVRPLVSLHLDSDGRGGDIVVFTGLARILEIAPPVEEVEIYFEKYRVGLKRLDLTPEAFAQRYRIAIRVTPETLRGH
jgi:PPOX class probable F420-dependent enzyme